MAPSAITASAVNDGGGGNVRSSRRRSSISVCFWSGMGLSFASRGRHGPAGPTHSASAARTDSRHEGGVPSGGRAGGGPGGGGGGPGGAAGGGGPHPAADPAGGTSVPGSGGAAGGTDLRNSTAPSSPPIVEKIAPKISIMTNPNASPTPNIVRLVSASRISGGMLFAFSRTRWRLSRLLGAAPTS